MELDPVIYGRVRDHESCGDMMHGHTICLTKYYRFGYLDGPSSVNNLNLFKMYPLIEVFCMLGV